MKKKKVAPEKKTSPAPKANKLSPVAKAEMLIRRPVADVFEAFVNPEITSGFWFTRGSGRLEAGKQLRWDWEMYGLSLQVKVKTIEPNARIVIEFPAGAPTLVEWTFTARPEGTTFVSIKHTGFVGEPEAIIQEAIGSTEGFTLVLAGLKGLLEHEVSLNLVSDRFPDGLEVKPKPAE